MGLGKKLENLVTRGIARIEQEFLGSSQDTPAHNDNSPPPPVPTHSHPAHGSPHLLPRTEPYSRPVFDPSLPVSHHFHHELGAHGWGNNELQNSVASPQNSFHTPAGKLILRAIASSIAPSRNSQYTSARLSSHQRLARPRGCLTARLTPPCAPGICPALWLLPHDPFVWPT